jgi:Nif-specific regulatory protein
MNSPNDSNSDAILDALSRISNAINTLQELDALLERIMDIAVETVGAERGYILLTDDTGAPQVRIARNLPEENLKDLTRISNSVVRQVLQTGETVLVYDTESEGGFEGMHSIIMYKIRSVACVPLKIKERPIGAIYLDSINHRSGFTHTSIPFLTTFANQAAIAIENAQLYQDVREENRQLRKEVQRAGGFAGIIGESAKMKQVFDMINSVLDSDATVLIQGESGTGKELVARALHHHGLRREKPFVALFCGSLPESLLESELFGHKKGAFTGAISDKKGLFEAADAGTFFLDEIGDISTALQTQLLRVLQEGEIKRVGENHVRKVDVRIITATNKDLQEKIKDRSFREDLFYRLNVINIYLPPLRERMDDVPLLAQSFLMNFAAKYKKNLHAFAPDVMDRLMHHDWPGNIRELKNTIERAVVLAKGALVGLLDLRLPETNGHAPSVNGAATLEELIRRQVEQTLQETGGNVTHAAIRLGVSRRWIQYKQKQWYHAQN